MTKLINTPESLMEACKNGLVKELHTSYVRTYVSRKSGSYVKRYSGKFGHGFALMSPNCESTQYSYITYYVYAK